MFKIQNYKYMLYKHILNIEEVTYVSNFKINIFYFMSTILYKHIHRIIFKSNLCIQKYFTISHINHIIFKSNLCTQKYLTFSHIKHNCFIGFILHIFFNLT